MYLHKDHIEDEKITISCLPPLLPNELVQRISFNSFSSPKFDKNDTNFKLPRLDNSLNKVQLTLLNNEFTSKESLTSIIGMTKIPDVIKIVKNDPKIDFIYMTPNVRKTNKNYHFYNLRVVTYTKVDKSDYLTISKRGMTRYRVGEDPEYVSLDQFEQEFTYYDILSKKKMFRQFPMWRVFNAWHKFIKREKFLTARNQIKNHLFIVDLTLQSCLLNVRELCLFISGLSMYAYVKNQTYYLQEFKQLQEDKAKQIKEELLTFRKFVKDIVIDTCKNSLRNHDFVPDYYIFEADNGDGLSTNILYSENFDLQILKEPPTKMSYMDQVLMRKYCQRLTRFIYYLDQLICNCLYHLAVKTVTEIVEHIESGVLCTPTDDYIQNWQSEIEAAVVHSPYIRKYNTAIAKKEDPIVKKDDPKISDILSIHNPIFFISLQLDSKSVLFNPDENILVESITQTVKNVLDVISKFPSLLPDAYFNAFTRPLINRKFEDKIYVVGPNLSIILNSDSSIHSMNVHLKTLISNAYKSAKKFSATFNIFWSIFNENMNLNLDIFNNEDTSIELFSESLEKFHQQYRMSDIIKTKQPIGLLMIELQNFKDQIMPSPLRCIEKLNCSLPKIAYSNLEKLMKELQDAEYKLDIICSNTSEYYSKLSFINQLQEKMEKLENDVHLINEMYRLIEFYLVPVPLEDMAIYHTLSAKFIGVQNLLDKNQVETERYLNTFEILIDKDYQQLAKELHALNSDMQNSILLDINSNYSQVNDLLNILELQLKEIERKYKHYQDYQSSLKLRQTELEEFDNCVTELYLKKLLWSSSNEWQLFIEDISEKTLEKLDLKMLSNNHKKYLGILVQLEKGLPKNMPVKRLCDKIDEFKIQLSTIIHLSNPCLKSRHILELDRILENNSMANQLTLMKLIDIEAFKFYDKIEEISLRASEESHLETIFKKVEDDLKSFEIKLIAHRDLKDIFLVESFNELTALISYCESNVAKTLNNKYRDFTAAKYKEWSENLNLFSQILSAWEYCEKSWKEVERAYSSADVQRQLPNEAKIFVLVDRNFKDFMRRVKKLPSAYRVLTQSGLLEQLHINNQNLKLLFSGLEIYLESKRNIYPRFNFISNDELLDGMTIPNNQLNLVTKCFPFIFNLDTIILEGSQNIIGVKSLGEDKVLLETPIKVHGNPESWILKLEEMISQTLKLYLKSTVRKMDYKNIEPILCEMPQQISHLAYQIFLFKKIEKIIDFNSNANQTPKSIKNSGKRIKSILTHHSYVINHFISQLTKKVHDQLNLEKIKSFIILGIYWRDILKDIMYCCVNDGLGEFKWSERIKYYWNEDDYTCEILVSTLKIQYGFEYIGLCERMVMTPVLENNYFNLMNSIRDYNISMINGPGDKFETIRDFSFICGKQLYAFDCNVKFDIKLLFQFMNGAMLTGSWICFKDLNNLDDSIIQSVFNYFSHIKKILKNKQNQLLFEEKEIKLNERFCIFNTLFYQPKMNISMELLSKFRTTELFLPDLTMIAEIYLFTEGFKMTDFLVKKLVLVFKKFSEKLILQENKLTENQTEENNLISSKKLLDIDNKRNDVISNSSQKLNSIQLYNMNNCEMSSIHDNQDKLSNSQIIDYSNKQNTPSMQLGTEDLLSTDQNIVLNNTVINNGLIKIFEHNTIDESMQNDQLNPNQNINLYSQIEINNDQGLIYNDDYTAQSNKKNPFNEYKIETGNDIPVNRNHVALVSNVKNNEDVLLKNEEKHLIIDQNQDNQIYYTKDEDCKNNITKNIIQDINNTKFDISSIDDVNEKMQSSFLENQRQIFDRENEKSINNNISEMKTKPLNFNLYSLKTILKCLSLLKADICHNIGEDVNKSIMRESRNNTDLDINKSRLNESSIHMIPEAREQERNSLDLIDNLDGKISKAFQNGNNIDSLKDIKSIDSNNFPKKNTSLEIIKNINVITTGTSENMSKKMSINADSISEISADDSLNNSNMNFVCNQEETLLKTAIYKYYKPQLEKSETHIFEVILDEIFPNINIMNFNNNTLLEFIEITFEQFHLTKTDVQVRKILELFEMLQYQDAIIIYGIRGAGKSTVFKILATVLDKFKHNTKLITDYKINLIELIDCNLFGKYIDNGWKKGSLDTIITGFNKEVNTDCWLVIKGPIDNALLFNSLIDSDKQLCEKNGSHLKITHNGLKIIFEILNLDEIPYETIDRCGVIYMDDIGWQPLVTSWLKFKCSPNLSLEGVNYIMKLFNMSVDNGIAFIQNNCQETEYNTSKDKVSRMCSILEKYLFNSGQKLILEYTDLRRLLSNAFIYAYIWGMGKYLYQENLEDFSLFVRDEFFDVEEAKLPIGSLFIYIMDPHLVRLWKKIAPTIHFDPLIENNIDKYNFASTKETVNPIQNLVHKIITENNLEQFEENSDVSELHYKYCDKYITKMLEQNNTSVSHIENQIKENADKKLDNKSAFMLGNADGIKMLLFIEDFYVQMKIVL